MCSSAAQENYKDFVAHDRRELEWATQAACQSSRAGKGKGWQVDMYMVSLGAHKQEGRRCITSALTCCSQLLLYYSSAGATKECHPGTHSHYIPVTKVQALLAQGVRLRPGSPTIAKHWPVYFSPCPSPISGAALGDSPGHMNFRGNKKLAGTLVPGGGEFLSTMEGARDSRGAHPGRR